MTDRPPVSEAPHTDTNTLERFAPIMAEHPMWVEERVCNRPGCGDEDYFDHILDPDLARKTTRWPTAADRRASTGADAPPPLLDVEELTGTIEDAPTAYLNTALGGNGEPLALWIKRMYGARLRAEPDGADR